LDLDRDVTHPDARVLGDAEQRQAVIGQESEGPHGAELISEPTLEDNNFRKFLSR
jgi:hypothetical protein